MGLFWKRSRLPMKAIKKKMITVNKIPFSSSSWLRSLLPCTKKWVFKSSYIYWKLSYQGRVFSSATRSLLLCTKKRCLSNPIKIKDLNTIENFLITFNSTPMESEFIFFFYLWRSLSSLVILKKEEPKKKHSETIQIFLIIFSQYISSK